MKEIALQDIQGFRIGNAQDELGGTGCTVLIFPDGAPCGVDIRGGGPASRESELLNPTAAAERIHAVLLSGGSAFGLNAAGGVMQYLEEKGIGFPTGICNVPLVVASCIFDLGCGDNVRPDAAMGYAACVASEKHMIREGNYGAGTGATVGKLCGPKGMMKSGLGVYAVQVGELKVGAVVTNGKFDKSHMKKIAALASNGFVRTIRPVNTTADGDSLYALSVGDVEADVSTTGTIAAYVVEQAVRRAVLTAEQAYGVPAAKSLTTY